MVRDYDISNNEKQFVLTALEQNIRLDGRKLLQMRDVHISVSRDEYGYAEVSLGKTKVACRVTAEITKPYEDRPFDGIFQISTEISPICSPFFESGLTTGGKQSNDEILISRLIEKAVRRSGALDLESLCIIAGSKCWAIRADLQFLNYDGNFIDISSIAVMVALLHFRKPDMEIDGNNVILFDEDQRNPVPLSILHIPLCFTFQFYNPNDDEENIKGNLNNELVLLDANLIEERLSLGSMTLTINKNKELCQMVKCGGLNIDASMIMNCCQHASNLVDDLTRKIHDVIRTDSELRKNPVEKELQVVNQRET
ncbi:hypothetical protein KL911_004003 [Ogataea haglerorum]|uniref:uncharacterized protein n=1 Tax=Ogataea haglerorum TaxID=1937702 RepID=UPI001C8A0925|nr:uncharacterized protein KL911_004003 [Ogataea haglerorum]KAG7695256.1 hypothetical protein KL951_003698 [Ogataea haglerorum]KAG7746812.1 hypothetical protein KL912_003941 [Ogataea haglerorum]KAG7752205.1 hypothetical protein KL911_004003 [Ogataea haglerorum]KAG7786624.1 hypothetical protein KL910_004024 [Ogataea haglerorum]KAG7787635.1 hypothetical protein KL945_002784 [Ogataea haglerorum]